MSDYDGLTNDDDDILTNEDDDILSNDEESGDDLSDNMSEDDGVVIDDDEIVKNDETILEDELDEVLSNDEDETILNVHLKYNKKRTKKHSKKIDNFSDPPLVNKNIVLERSNKQRTVIIVEYDDRITSDHFQKGERAALIAIRGKQIANNGAPEYLNEIVEEMKKNKINISSNDIAEAELMNKKCPLKLRREIGVNAKDELIVEEWDPNDMKIHI